MRFGGCIYFIAPVGGGLIKIGAARLPEKRLRNMQVHCPVRLELLAWADGTIHDERKLHRLFLDSRAHGEWFEPTPELLALIGRVRTDHEIPERYRASGEEQAVLWKGGNAFRKSPEQRRHMRQLEAARNIRNARAA